MKEQILYFFDPLCGWCYGFGETMSRFHEIHSDQYDFLAIPGGMVTGSRVGPMKDMEDYISKAYPQVEQTTGVKFGEKYTEGLLRSKETMMDSEPPSRAVLTFRTYANGRSFEFAHELQKMHYSAGRDYNEEMLYQDLAQHFALDPEEFLRRFHSQEMKQKTQKEFSWVNESGINGFPTVIFGSDQQYHLLTRGYADLETIKTSLEKARQSIKA